VKKVLAEALESDPLWVEGKRKGGGREGGERGGKGGGREGEVRGRLVLLYVWHYTPYYCTC
jgi:hypothetical protein